MTVKEIEQAIEQLPRHELAELTTWFTEYQAQVWDKQIADDLDSGRLFSLPDDLWGYQPGDIRRAMHSRCEPQNVATVLAVLSTSSQRGSYPCGQEL